MPIRFLNSTPFRLAAFPMRLHPKRITATWVVKGTFDLKPGGAASPREKDAQDLLSGETCGGQDQTGECLYPGDFDPMKPGADLLLKGTCHAPGGKPVPVCTVRFGVGGWKKALAVIGKRIWRKSLLGASFSDPAPFAAMPLGWSGAFGGLGFKDNPVGKGFRTEELPTQEAPDRLIRLPSDQPAPAGFGPINSRWAARTAKLGTFNRKWAAERWPALPENFDGFHFNAAPPDQQLASYLRGDETLLVENLRPGAPRFEARLPGLRIRVFVRDLRGDKRPVREIPMRLDTLYADLDEAKLVLLWRGVGDVLDDELLDVEAILAVSEPLSSAPKPPAAYAPEFDRKPEEPAPVPALPPPAEDVPAKIAAEAAAIQKEVDLRLAAAGESAERFKASIGPWGKQVPDPRAAAGSAADVAGLLRVPPPSALQTKRELVATLKRAREAHQGMVAKAEAVSGTCGKAAEIAAAALGSFPMKPPELPAAAKQVFGPGGPVEKVLKAIGMEGSLDAPEGLSNARCAALLKSGEPLAGRDFTGADFSGLVLDGRDLSKCALSGALFAGASLRGARLAGAGAKEADFTRADLSGADLGGGRFD
ncbi:MAG: DUF2169 domain-containing protein, partial [Planctomycetes bacterium]|nr:DUF2169 domain-containing protein [Planctomycetota bacterium]